MSEYNYCGKCCHFDYEDADGDGICQILDECMNCLDYGECEYYEEKNKTNE